MRPGERNREHSAQPQIHPIHPQRRRGQLLRHVPGPHGRQEAVHFRVRGFGHQTAIQGINRCQPRQSQPAFRGQNGPPQSAEVALKLGQGGSLGRGPDVLRESEGLQGGGHQVLSQAPNTVRVHCLPVRGEGVGRRSVPGVQKQGSL